MLYCALAETQGWSNLLNDTVAVLYDELAIEPVLIFDVNKEPPCCILNVPGSVDCVVNLKKSSPSFTCIDVFAAV